MNALEDFPVISLLPKKETGVLSFLTKHPKYDGRGTTIAIFDSGVDPGASGLQVTTDGRRKVIHRFDCSGCGDVSTTTIVKDTEGHIVGLTGRKLQIPKEWKNPTKTYRIGLKQAFSLYPESLREQMKTKYKEKHWDETHREVLAEASRKLAKFELEIGNSTLSDEDKVTKENLEAEIDILNSFEKKFSYTGPVYDCVLFHDGDMWRCCVDSSEEGNLEKCPLLGEYSLTGDYAALSDLCNLNYSFNVHDDGDVLELVGLCSVHGTLVAAIAAANFPDRPEENGIAPGAQIVSLGIGDGRLGSMETGTALIRAMIKVMELSKTQKIDVINMSYGEHANWSDVGRVGDLMCEVVNKYGVTWVVSAGNHGPALNTIGTPPDIVQDILIGVGAYVSPDMMVAGYSMRQKLPGMPYTWSSRGPTADGGMGVTVCAPGAATTSPPNFTLKYSELCNGTSMSSPHTAGAVSLLISGLKEMGLSYSPYNIKRAIEVSATYLPNEEIYAQGSGLLDVEKTFDYLTKHHKEIETNVRFNLSCIRKNGKGILIKSDKSVTNHSCSVTVQPFFLDSDNVPAQTKINFNMRLGLTSGSYVSAPTHLDLSHSMRMFLVKVDTSTLPVGVHTAFITAYDLSNVEKGHMFKVPITVIVPEDLKSPNYELRRNDILFKPNTIQRHFINVPKYATWFKLRLWSEDKEAGKFVIHVMQILPKKSCKTIDQSKTISVGPNNEAVFGFKVVPEVPVEIVVAKYWASIGEVKLNYLAQFYGIEPDQKSVTMHSADGIHVVQVTSLQDQEVLPNVALKNAVQILKPSESKVTALTKRDVIPVSRQIYELVLVYNFALVKGTEVSPSFPLLNDVLYESEFESQLWMLYDNNKQLIGCGDAYFSKYSLKLEKGDYVVRLQIRHEKKEHLERITDAPLLVYQKLANTISVDVYSSYQQAVTGGKKAGSHQIVNSVPKLYYIAPIPSDKLPSKPNNAAQYLTGSITYIKNDVGRKVDSYPFKYILVEGSNKKSSSNSATSDKTKLEEYQEAVRDLKVQWLSKLDSENEEKVFFELSGEYPDYAHLYVAHLLTLDPLESNSALPPFGENTDIAATSQESLLSLCDKIINMLNIDNIFGYLFSKTSDTNKSKKSIMDQKKSDLIEALTHKGIILCRSYLKTTTPDLLHEVNDIWKSLARFIDLSDTKSPPSGINVLFFLIWYYNIHKLYNKAFRCLMKLQEEKSSKEIEEKIIELCHFNGWTHIEKYLISMLPSKFCNTYKPF